MWERLGNGKDLRAVPHTQDPLAAKKPRALVDLTRSGWHATQRPSRACGRLRCSAPPAPPAHRPPPPSDICEKACTTAHAEAQGVTACPVSTGYGTKGGGTLPTRLAARRPLLLAPSATRAPRATGVRLSHVEFETVQRSTSTCGRHTWHLARGTAHEHDVFASVKRYPIWKVCGVLL